jgi:hypothetical protein
MKTTVEIPDGLFDQVEKFAHAHDLTVDEVFQTGVRKVIADERSAKPFQLRDASVGGEGMVKDYTWAEIKAIARER